MRGSIRTLRLVASLLLLVIVMIVSVPSGRALNSQVKYGDFEIFANLPGFIFSSGAGAWATILVINSDGTFTGDYHDSDMEAQGTSYPNGTRYECKFSGKFTAARKINDTGSTVPAPSDVSVTTLKPYESPESTISVQPYDVFIAPFPILFVLIIPSIFCAIMAIILLLIRNKSKKQKSDEDTIICEKCGKALPGWATFCAYCGENTIKNDSAKRRSKLLLIISIVLVLICLFTALMATLYITENGWQSVLFGKLDNGFDDINISSRENDDSTFDGADTHYPVITDYADEPQMAVGIDTSTSEDINFSGNWLCETSEENILLLFGEDNSFAMIRGNALNDSSLYIETGAITKADQGVMLAGEYGSSYELYEGSDYLYADIDGVSCVFFTSIAVPNEILGVWKELGTESFREFNTDGMMQEISQANMGRAIDYPYLYYSASGNLSIFPDTGDILRFKAHVIGDYLVTQDSEQQFSVFKRYSEEFSAHTPIGKTPAPSNALPDESTLADEYMVIAVNSTRVRSAPNLNGTILTTLGAGSQATYLGETETDERGIDWYKVQTLKNFYVGWVSSANTYLTPN